MTEPSSKFIKEEAVPTRTGLLALNWRLFTSLPLFLGLLPLSIATILLSSAAPSVFRWYSGSFASGGVGFTLGGLVAITALAIACRIAAWAFFEISGMWSSQRLHAAMVRGLAQTRTTFFDEIVLSAEHLAGRDDAEGAGVVQHFRAEVLRVGEPAEQRQQEHRRPGAGEGCDDADAEHFDRRIEEVADEDDCC